MAFRRLQFITWWLPLHFKKSTCHKHFCINLFNFVLPKWARIQSAIPAGTAMLPAILFFDELNQDQKGTSTPFLPPTTDDVPMLCWMKAMKRRAKILWKILRTMTWQMLELYRPRPQMWYIKKATGIAIGVGIGITGGNSEAMKPTIPGIWI